MNFYTHQEKLHSEFLVYFLQIATVVELAPIQPAAITPLKYVPKTEGTSSCNSSGWGSPHGTAGVGSHWSDYCCSCPTRNDRYYLNPCRSGGTGAPCSCCACGDWSSCCGGIGRSLERGSGGPEIDHWRWYFIFCWWWLDYFWFSSYLLETSLSRDLYILMEMIEKLHFDLIWQTESGNK